MSFDPSKYKNQNHLKHSGKALAKRLNEPTKKAISELNDITDKVEVDFISSGIDYEVFLPRFWDNSSSLEEIEEEFESKRDRRNLIKGLGRGVNGKVILRDYPHIESLLWLLPFGDKSIKIITNIYLTNFELIQNYNSVYKAFQNYFEESLKPDFITTPRVNLILNSKEFLTSYNGVKLFVDKKLKNFNNIDDVLRSCGFNNANTDFKKLVSYEYLYKCFRNGQVDMFLDIYEELLEYGDMVKRVIPLLVLLAKDSQQFELKKLAEEKSEYLIGNPLIKMKWTPPSNYKNEEIKRLEKARRTLSEWFIESFIGVFFQELAKDPRRKSYWLNNLTFIKDIKVFGNNAEINKFLSSFKDQFGVNKLNVIKERVNYYHLNDKTCGIVMNIGGYEIVEFSDEGALYCYVERNNRIKKQVISSRDLKDTSMPLAISAKSSMTYHEGRISHQGNWEKRVDSWLLKYAI